MTGAASTDGSRTAPATGVADLVTAVLDEEQALLRGLALWAAGSIVAGVALTGRGRRRPSTARDVGRQALGWGLVDLAIVAWGARGLRRGRRGALTADAARVRGRRMGRVTAANAVLDIGYVAAGAVLAARGPARRGDGLGIVVQGLALLWLDVRHASAFRRLTSTVPGSGPGERT
jgi:hypothetical protein